MTGASPLFTPLHHHLAPAIEATANRQKETYFPHVFTGFPTLDKTLHGLPSGEVTILGGHPSVGKTTLTLNIATSAAIHGPVLFFSTTNSVQDLTDRIICAWASVKNDQYLAGKMNIDEWERVTEAVDRLYDLPLMFGGEPLSTMSDLENTVDAVESGVTAPHLIIIDDIHTLKASDEHQNRYEEIADLSRRIRALASKRGIAVLVTAQLNRDIYWRTQAADYPIFTRPQLSDLRDSGTLEYDASTIIMLHRPDLFDKDDERAGEADLLILKNAHGPTDTIPMAHQLHYCRFVDVISHSHSTKSV